LDKVCRMLASANTRLAPRQREDRETSYKVRGDRDRGQDRELDGEGEGWRTRRRGREAGSRQGKSD
jgi:hypothetical protein